MATDWISTIVVGIVIVVGILIMYKALKEPFDMLFRGIRNMFGYVRDKITDSGESGYEVIRYG